MARRYEMVHINKVIYIGNYLSNGLTINRRKHNITSPIGCMRRAEEFMKSDIKFKYRIKGGLQYIIYGKFAGFNTLKLIHNVQNKWIVMICILPGLILHQRWKNLSKARCKN